MITTIRDYDHYHKLLRESTNPQAQFVWAILRDSFHYCAVHLAAIAETARDVDFAMRWGFGMQQGPFELWQQAGWKQVAQWVKEDIEAGKALLDAYGFPFKKGADANEPRKRKRGGSGGGNSGGRTSGVGTSG